MDSNVAVTPPPGNHCLTRTSPFTCPPGLTLAMGVVSNSGCGPNCILSNSWVWNVAFPANVYTGGGGAPTRVNVTVADPVLAAPAQLTSAPDCHAAATAFDCMASVRANFAATAVGATSLGYQPPGPCAPDPNYPVWLKGAVPDGLLTKPCGF